LHSIAWLFKNFRAGVEALPISDERKILQQICRLYGLWQMELEAAQFLASGYLKGEHLAREAR